MRRIIPIGTAFGILVSVMFIALGARSSNASTPAAPALAPTDVFLSLDCDTTTAGIQSSCTQSAAGPLDVAVVLTNNSAADVSLAAFNFDVLGDNKPMFTPNANVDGNRNGNPDLNDAAFPNTVTFNCNLPAPQPDDDIAGDPVTTSRSRLVCFTGANDGPTVAAGTSVVLGTVHYTVSGTSGVGNFSFSQVAINDNNFNEVGSCNDVIANGIDCFGATVTLGSVAASPTATNTAGAVNTNTATSTSTSTPAAATSTPTSTAAGATSTSTNTPVATSTNTSTAVATDTATAGTMTPVPTSTNTVVATNTVAGETSTPDATNTSTAIATATDTSTVVAGASATPVATETSTAIATDTATTVASQTPQVTETSTATPQPSVTVTATATSTPGGSICSAADVNGDGHVDITDLVLVARHLGRHRFDARYDVNQDGRTNARDILIVIGCLDRFRFDHHQHHDNDNDDD